MKFWLAEVRDHNHDIAWQSFHKTEEGGYQAMAKYIYEEELRPQIEHEFDPDSPEHALERAQQKQYKEFADMFRREQYKDMLTQYSDYCYENNVEIPWYHSWELTPVEPQE